MAILNRCNACDCTFKPIPGDGPYPCKVMFIGERPGIESQRAGGDGGRPLSGNVGREFDGYLRRAGLSRDEVYVTNVVKCPVAGKRKTTPVEIEQCSLWHLRYEISECAPDVVVLMGAVACGLAYPDIDLDMQSGIPVHGDIMAGVWEGPIIPMHHPAAGLHDTGNMIPLQEDFTRLRAILAGEWFAPDDPYPTPDYGLMETVNDLTKYLDDGLEACDAMGCHMDMATDMETHGPDPFSVQISHTPGTARMMLASNQRVVKTYADWVESTSATFIFHQAGGDQDILNRMGIYPKDSQVQDTMQQAYHLGNLPQGLKELVYRKLGVRMRNWADVVMPHSREALNHWLVETIDVAEKELSVTTHKQLKTKVKTIVTPGVLERGLRRIFKHAVTSDKYKPWEKIDELMEALALTNDPIAEVAARRLIGIKPVPILGIGNVPLPEAVQYGCMDADFTLRAAYFMAGMRQELTGPGGKWEIAEGDENQ